MLGCCKQSLLRLFAILRLVGATSVIYDESHITYQTLFEDISTETPATARMLVIGLAGGIASGKSLVARYFSELGAEVIDADRIGHEVLNDGGVKKQVRATWGDNVFEAGEINRSAISRIVFDADSGESELKKLEAITHPVINQRIKTEIQEKRERGVLAVVLDAPVMFKAGWHEVCDKIVFVDTPLPIRMKRTLDRGWSADELERREARQLSLAKKRESSTDVIDNSKEQKRTFAEVKRLWQQWRLPLPKSDTGETNSL